jgi:hypothetical protein
MPFSIYSSGSARHIQLPPYSRYSSFIWANTTYTRSNGTMYTLETGVLMDLSYGISQVECMRTQTAAQQRVHRFYHCQPFDMARLARIFTERTICCSNPEDFNDPWDCKPCFSKTLLHDVAGYDRIVQWFVALGRKRNLSIVEDEHHKREAELRSNRKLLEWMIDEASHGLWRAVSNQYRVYCQSALADVPLMWSHYAQSHRGLCLEFSTQNELFCGALPVVYRDTYPLFDLADSSEDAALAVLLTKSDDWRYESEFRLIATAPGHFSPGMLQSRANFVKVPAGTLKGVIMGCLMADE